ncbi:MAG: hypothetical protein AAFQ43_06135, partial [Bacteroidota bacterium]
MFALVLALLIQPATDVVDAPLAPLPVAPEIAGGGGPADAPTAAPLAPVSPVSDGSVRDDSRDATRSTSSPEATSPEASRPEAAAPLSTVLLVRPDAPEALADTTRPDPVVAGLLSSFALPLSDWLEPEHDSEWRNLISGLSFSAASSVPLAKREPLGRVEETVGPVVIRGSGGQGERTQNLTVRVGLRYRPISNWFAMATGYHYLEPSVKRPWDPD